MQVFQKMFQIKKNNKRSDISKVMSLLLLPCHKCHPHQILQRYTIAEI